MSGIQTGCVLLSGLAMHAYAGGAQAPNENGPQQNTTSEPQPEGDVADVEYEEVSEDKR